MPILSMVPPFSPGSRLWKGNSITEVRDENNNVITYTNDDGKECPVLATHLIGISESYVGCCISESERNGYSDSDFYMLVWDEEKKEARSIEFASTRGWSYPCMGSYVDATPEVLEQYDAWKKQKDRNYKAYRIRAVRKQAFEVAKQLNVSYTVAMRLMAALGGERWKLPEVIKLMTANLRSPFKISLRENVQTWLCDPNPKYPAPLSPKQIARLYPFAYGQFPRGGYRAAARDREIRPVENFDLIKEMAR